MKTQKFEDSLTLMHDILQKPLLNKQVRDYDIQLQMLHCMSDLCSYKE